MFSSTTPLQAGLVTVASLGLILQSSGNTNITVPPSMPETPKKVSDFIERNSQIQKLNVEIKRQCKNLPSLKNRASHWNKSGFCR